LILLDTSYGDLRGDLERMGTPIGACDTLIVVHALCLRVGLLPPL